VDQLDLVIAVDTAVVHVAGALNKPCWVMIPNFATDWRWMLDREDSPWYPSLKLFRQDPSGNWKTTIERMQLALKEEINMRGQIDE
jgi:ADP-heptose:LPS heptosyltransferase